jgi:hypothetical protein
MGKQPLRYGKEWVFVTNKWFFIYYDCRIYVYICLRVESRCWKGDGGVGVKRLDLLKVERVLVAMSLNSF